jgi:protein-S-isoprenylcysteine O-methyltransferase Ste14
MLSARIELEFWYVFSTQPRGIRKPSKKTAASLPQDDVIMTPLVCEVIWFAGIACWYVIRYPFERKAKKFSVKKSLFGRRESSILGAAFIGLVAIPAVYTATDFPRSLDRPFIPAIAWLGLITLCAGLWLFFRSHADLGRNWSISLEIREQHALVQSGVYRLIRHPMYSSFFLLALAQLFLLPNWFAGAAGLLGVGILYAFRVRQEERMMRESFGDEYLGYSAKTKRLIPWVI